MSVKSWNVHWPSGRPSRLSGRWRRRQPVQRDEFRAELTGFEEVPPVLTPARGTFVARVTAEGDGIEYELAYTGLSTPAFEAHLHFAQPGTNGEIFAYLCGGDASPCPGEGGVVSGVLRAEDILAVPEQGLEAGDLAGALSIMRRGLAYVNVHSAAIPRGEIRGQVRPSFPV